MIRYYNSKPNGRPGKAKSKFIDPAEAVIGNPSWRVDGDGDEAMKNAVECVFTDIFDPPCFIPLTEYLGYSPARRRQMRRDITNARVLNQPAAQQGDSSDGAYRLLRTTRHSSPASSVSPGLADLLGCGGWPAAGH